MATIIKKLLIPNRGEIAVRIIRAAQLLGIRTLVTLHRGEVNTLPARMADEVHWWESDLLSDTFLNVDAIVGVAKRCDADALHPGYGFLSENDALAQACVDAGILFVGPTAQHLRLMGNKIEARRMAQQAGIPVASGWEGSVCQIAAMAHQLPYPVLIKAALGGGGRGMAPVFTADELHQQLTRVAAEAMRYFGDDALFVEQYFVHPRHIEVQVMADAHGHIVHLFERECSIQRRHQKIVEEAPAICLSDQQRQKITADAVRLAESIGYVNAGTVEFLLDGVGDHYFLEMNTRIQVEHPVTEMITGIDLVVEQLKVAMGHPLSFSQNEIQIKGHAIETRVYAEDPVSDFAPSPGNLQTIVFPEPSLNCRVETAYDRACELMPTYDPLLAKIVTFGQSRIEAIEMHRQALMQTFCDGVKNNVDYLLQLLGHEDFMKGQIHTGFINAHHQDLIHRIADVHPAELLPYVAWKLAVPHAWHPQGFWRSLPVLSVEVQGKTVDVRYGRNGNVLDVMVGGVAFGINVFPDANGCFDICVNGADGELLNRLGFVPSHHRNGCYAFRWQMLPQGVMLLPGRLKLFVPGDWLPDYQPVAGEVPTHRHIVAPLPGNLLRIAVAQGQQVTKGTTLAVIEAMKTENHIKAPHNLVVAKIHFREGDRVNANAVLMSLEGD